MTNTNNQTFKPYYPEIKLPSAPSEHYEKYYRDRLAAQQANKHVDDDYGWLFRNANFGVTEK